MATANERFMELRRYIEDLEEGLTMRLEALGARLGAIEHTLGRIDASLVAEVGPAPAEVAALADEPGL